MSNTIDNIEFREMVKEKERNVWLSTKGDTQDERLFLQLGRKFGGIDRLTLINYAGTSLFSRSEVARAYDEYTEWFFDELEAGRLEANVVLTAPDSFAAKDAATNKMYPRGLNRDPHEIIQHNINTLLLKIMKDIPNARIHFYLTDICLPYAILYGESNAHPERDFIKVDLYSPRIRVDDDRPSFYLLYEEQKTRSIFQFFLGNITEIMSSAKEYSSPYIHDISWLRERPIIHRGKVRVDIPEHSLSGYWECIKRGLPMEVDILFLSDGTPIIGREQKLLCREEMGKEPFYLSGLTMEQIRGYRSDELLDDKGKALKFRVEELMTLAEFLILVNGAVGLLIEIKEDASVSCNVVREHVERVLKELKYYNGSYAIHSAHYIVLKEVREHNPMIPLGQISWSFSSVDVPEEYREVHATLQFVDIVRPDFISYKIDEIEENVALRQMCKQKNLPLLAWTITDAGEEEQAKRYCDNVIIEGAESFLK